MIFICYRFNCGNERFIDKICSLIFCIKKKKNQRQEEKKTLYLRQILINNKI